MTEHRSINAVVESFFGTLKRELIHRRGWPTRREAAEAIHEYIEVFYNRRRRHTTLGGKSPAVFEALALTQVAQAAYRNRTPNRGRITGPRYALTVPMTKLGARSRPPRLVAGIAIVSSAALTLALANLIFEYLHLSESYMRLILG